MSPRDEDFFFATIRQLEHAAATDRLSKAYKYESEAVRHAWFDMRHFLLAAPERLNQTLPLLGSVTAFTRLSRSCEGRGLMLRHRELIEQLTVALSADEIMRYAADISIQTAGNFNLMLAKTSDAVLNANGVFFAVVDAFIKNHCALPLRLMNRVSDDVLHESRENSSLAFKLLAEETFFLAKHPEFLARISREAKVQYARRQAKLCPTDFVLQHLIDIPHVFSSAIKYDKKINLLKQNVELLNKLMPDCVDASVVAKLLSEALCRELVASSEHLQRLVVPYLQQDKALVKPLVDDKSGLLAKLVVAGLQYTPKQATEKPAAATRQPQPSLFNRLANCVSAGSQPVAGGDYIALSDGASATAKKNN